jgi:zinc/manganese transport system permease protein
MDLANLGFSWSLMGAPLVAGLLIVSTHVLMGRRVLERGIIFIDITIAQVAALGVILADVSGAGERPGWVTQAAACAAALLAAGFLTWSERKLPEVQEAMIGSLYVISASVALLVLASNPHGAEHMQQLLAGQILWVGWSQIVPVAVLYAAILAIWAAWAHRRPWAFYLLFAVTVTASVQLVGVYLVFATLILPALATHRLASRPGLIVAYAIGAGGYGLGLWLSVPLDLPTGPLVVCALAGLALLAAATSPLWARRLGRTPHVPGP